MVSDAHEDVGLVERDREFVRFLSSNDCALDFL